MNAITSNINTDNFYMSQINSYSEETNLEQSSEFINEAEYSYDKQEITNMKTTDYLTDTSEIIYDLTGKVIENTPEIKSENTVSVFEQSSNIYSTIQNTFSTNTISPKTEENKINESYIIPSSDFIAENEETYKEYSNSILSEIESTTGSEFISDINKDYNDGKHQTIFPNKTSELESTIISSSNSDIEFSQSENSEKVLKASTIESSLQTNSEINNEPFSETSITQSEIKQLTNEESSETIYEKSYSTNKEIESSISSQLLLLNPSSQINSETTQEKLTQEINSQSNIIPSTQTEIVFSSEKIGGSTNSNTFIEQTEKEISTNIINYSEESYSNQLIEEIPESSMISIPDIFTESYSSKFNSYGLTTPTNSEFVQSDTSKEELTSSIHDISQTIISDTDTDTTKENNSENTYSNKFLTESEITNGPFIEKTYSENVETDKSTEEITHDTSEIILSEKMSESILNSTIINTEIKLSEKYIFISDTSHSEITISNTNGESWQESKELITQEISAEESNKKISQEKEAYTNEPSASVFNENSENAIPENNTSSTDYLFSETNIEQTVEELTSKGDTINPISEISQSVNENTEPIHTNEITELITDSNNVTEKINTVDISEGTIEENSFLTDTNKINKETEVTDSVYTDKETKEILSNEKESISSDKEITSIEQTEGINVEVTEESSEEKVTNTFEEISNEEKAINKETDTENTEYLNSDSSKEENIKEEKSYQKTSPINTDTTDLVTEGMEETKEELSNTNISEEQQNTEEKSKSTSSDEYIEENSSNFDIIENSETNQKESDKSNEEKNTNEESENTEENEINESSEINQEINNESKTDKENKKEMTDFFSDEISFSDISDTSKIIPLTNPNETNETIIIDINISKEELNIANILKDIQIGSNYKYFGPNYILFVKPTNSSEFEKSTNINFTDCEKLVRSQYNIEDKEILTMVQLESENTDNDRVLTNQVEYQIYFPNKTYLNTSICSNITIPINYILNSNIQKINYNLVNQYRDMDINVFDINEPFFTDICTPYSSNGNDMILEDRHDYIYQNFSLCDKNCENPEVNLDKNTVTCQCKIKDSITNTEAGTNFQQIDYDKISKTNLDVIKCTNLVFSFKNKDKNAGFILFFIIAAAFLGLIILHIIRGINPVPDFIYKEMRKYDYLKKDDRKFFEEDDPEKRAKFKNYNKKNVATIGNISISNNRNPGSILNSKTSKKKYISNISPNPNKSSNSSERNLMNSNFLFQNKDIEDAKFNPPIRKILKNKNIILAKPKAHVLDVNMNEKDDISVKEEEKIDDKNVDNFGIMKINLKEPKDYFFPRESKLTLRNYNYKEAIKYENRNTWRILYIFLLAKQIIFHTFFENSPLVPFHIKISLFLFMFSFDIAINALFYTNTNISKKYHTSKDLFSFTMTNNVLIIIISTLVSLVFISIIIKLNKIDAEIRTIFAKEETKLKKNRNYNLDYPTKMRVFSEVEKVLKYYKIKSIIVLIFEFLVILFFWYFVTAFCQVYANTQGSLALNILIAVLIRFVIEIIICLIFAKLYYISTHIDFSCFYGFVLFVYDLTC